MTEFTMTIDGSAATPEAYFDVVDPATARVLAQAPDCTPRQLDAAMAAAAGAQPAWSRDERGRRHALNEAAAVIEAHAGRLAALVTAEQGKPLAQARDEVMASAVWLRHYAQMELPHEIVQDDDEGYAEIVARPLGVVAAIAPWNFPVVLAVWKIAPALLAGNTVVLKPSPYTPLATLHLGELLRTCLPAGVLNVISGRDPLGASMTAHPVPRKISFTGSTATGRRVAVAAAGDLKRVTLELGGNDPAIVLPDAEPEEFAASLVRSAFVNSGQVCFAVKRIYVPAERHDAWVQALTVHAAALRVGAGHDDQVEMGPLSNRAQLDRVTALVDDARARGALVATGGAPLAGEGYFYAPTVLAGAADGMPVVDEEQFGPVLPVVAYRNPGDAVAAANASAYGLTASVWSPDTDRAAGLARSLDCGQVSLNAHGAGVRPDLPFGGSKASGIGRENGRWGLEEFTQLQVFTRPPKA
ncbi:aldehyde dehydrogenase family protein [Streptomyces sp. NPDC048350]|uniref:aldehyde dehydrogenase family protein n=1 Tax=Streptomyces sp. NPDC048350 TaxID=3365538 RepID=UPI00371F53A7